MVAGYLTRLIFKISAIAYVRIVFRTFFLHQNLGLVDAIPICDPLFYVTSFRIFDLENAFFTLFHSLVFCFLLGSGEVLSGTKIVCRATLNQPDL